MSSFRPKIILYVFRTFAIPSFRPENVRRKSRDLIKKIDIPDASLVQLSSEKRPVLHREATSNFPDVYDIQFSSEKMRTSDFQSKSRIYDVIIMCTSRYLLLYNFNLYNNNIVYLLSLLKK